MSPYFFILTALLCFELVAQDKTLTWAIPDFAPVFMKNQKGYLDRYLLEVQKQLPDYEHKTVAANFARAVEMMKSGQNVCSLSMFKTPEREKYLTYTSPYMLIHSNHLIVNKNAQEDLSAFIKNGEIDLEKFLKSGKRIGLSYGRSYGKRTDELLSKFMDTNQLDIRRGNDVFASLFGMLNLGRLDGILGYKAELRWFSDKIEHNAIQSYPLKDEDLYFLGHAACGRTEWGLKTVKRIDSVLDRLKLEPKYYGIYLEFVPDVDSTVYGREVQSRLKSN